MATAVPYVVHPGHETWLAEAGLGDLASCRSYAGGSVVKAERPGRSTVSFQAAGHPYFLKRIHGPAAGEIDHEARVLGQLRSLGFPVAEVAAVGVDGAFGALITAALPVTGTLEAEVAATPVPAALARRRRQVASLVRELHARGVQHRDFYLTHLLVGADGGLYVADLGRALLLPRLGWLRRIKDLAALDFSTPARAASDWARMRFLREYAGASPKWRLRLVAWLVRSKARRMRRHVARQIARLEPNYHLSG